MYNKIEINLHITINNIRKYKLIINKLIKFINNI